MLGKIKKWTPGNSLMDRQPTAPFSFPTIFELLRPLSGYHEPDELQPPLSAAHVALLFYY